MKTSLNVSPMRPRLRLGAFMGSKSQRTPLIDTYVSACRFHCYQSLDLLWFLRYITAMQNSVVQLGTARRWTQDALQQPAPRRIMPVPFCTLANALRSDSCVHDRAAY
ncbi:hypothetical protein BDR07DRAFT_1416284, partial [Suillus spraguei]